MTTIPKLITLTGGAQLVPGDVIEDSYGNPAVVLAASSYGKWIRIMQTVGSDRGRHGSRSPRDWEHNLIRQYRSAETVEWAREVARDEWRAGRRWTV